MNRWNPEAYDVFFVDVDGVLVHDSEPIDGAPEAFRALRGMGDVFVLTNNSTRSRAQHASRLAKLGFDVTVSEVVSSSYVVAEWLKGLRGATTVWPVGEAGLTEELVTAGHRIAKTPEDAQWVVAGMDRSIDYRKLFNALRALRAGARLAATNEDATYPTPEGPMPGAGAIVGALRGMGFSPSVNVGKPECYAYDIASELANVDKRRILMIGDRLETDILGGNRCGIDTLLVLSGISSAGDIASSGIYATWVSDSLVTVISGDVSRGR
jgi:NagD protein